MTFTNLNTIEVIGLDGKTWYLWLDKVEDADMINEMMQALKIYPKIKINNSLIVDKI